MNHSNYKIFLIQPIASKKHPAYLIYTENEKTARKETNIFSNPMQRINPGDKTPLCHDTYSNEKLSTCNKVNAEIIEHLPSSVRITYQDKEYTLPKDHPKEIGHYEI